MGIVRDERDIYWAAYDDYPTCFYCLKQAKFPFLMWSGSDGEISFHPPCFAEFAIRMFRDLHEVECDLSASLTFSMDPVRINKAKKS